MEPITICFAASSIMMLAGGLIIDRKYSSSNNVIKQLKLSKATLSERLVSTESSLNATRGLLNNEREALETLQKEHTDLGNTFVAVDAKYNSMKEHLKAFVDD